MDRQADPPHDGRRIITTHTRPSGRGHHDNHDMKPRGNHDNHDMKPRGQGKGWLQFLQEEDITVDQPAPYDPHKPIKVRASQVLSERPVQSDRTPRGDCRRWRDFLESGDVARGDHRGDHTDHVTRGDHVVGVHRCGDHSGGDNRPAKGDHWQVKGHAATEPRSEDDADRKQHVFFNERNMTHSVHSKHKRSMTPAQSRTIPEIRRSSSISPSNHDASQSETSKESLFLSKSSEGKEMWRISRSGSGADKVFKVVRTDRAGASDAAMVTSLARHYSTMSSCRADRQENTIPTFRYDNIHDESVNKCSHNLSQVTTGMQDLCSNRPKNHNLGERFLPDKMTFQPLSSEDSSRDIRTLGRRTRGECWRQVSSGESPPGAATPGQVDNHRDGPAADRNNCTSSVKYNLEDSHLKYRDGFTEAFPTCGNVPDKNIRLIDHLEQTETQLTMRSSHDDYDGCTKKTKAESQQQSGAYRASSSKTFSSSAIGKMHENSWPSINRLLANIRGEAGAPSFTFRPITPESAASLPASSASHALDNNANARSSVKSSDRKPCTTSQNPQKYNPDFDDFCSASKTSLLSNTRTLRDSSSQYSPPLSPGQNSHDNDEYTSKFSRNTHSEYDKHCKKSNTRLDSLRPASPFAELSDCESFAADRNNYRHRLHQQSRSNHSHTAAVSPRSASRDTNTSCCHDDYIHGSRKKKSESSKNNDAACPTHSHSSIEDNRNVSNKTIKESRKLRYTAHRESPSDAATYRVEALHGQDAGSRSEVTDLLSNTPITLNQLQKILQKTKEDSHVTPGNTSIGQDINCNSENFNLLSSIDKDFENSSPYIGQFLHKLWRTQCFCDVKVQVGDQCFLAHKLVLAAFSDVFYPTTPQPPPSVCFTIPNSSPEAVFQVFKYLYTSSMDLRDDLLEPVMAAAIFMGITEIQEVIKDILQRPTVENVALYVKTARQIGMPASITDYPALIRDNFKELAKSRDFMELSVEDMEKLLSDPDVMVDTEMDTVEVLSYWLQYNLMERAPLVGRLLRNINFEAIEPTKIASLQEDYPHIFCTPEGIDVIASAFKYHALKNIPGTEQLWFERDQLNDRPKSVRNARESPPRGGSSRSRKQGGSSHYDPRDQISPVRVTSPRHTQSPPTRRAQSPPTRQAQSLHTRHTESLHTRDFQSTPTRQAQSMHSRHNEPHTRHIQSPHTRHRSRHSQTEAMADSND